MFEIIKRNNRIKDKKIREKGSESERIFIKDGIIGCLLYLQKMSIMKCLQ